MKIARLSALASLAAVLAACGEDPVPPPPAPPTVRLMPMPREVLGTELEFRVEVVGCDQVSRVEVRDRQSLLAHLDDPPALSTLVAPAKAVRFKERGIPAGLALFADATCDDGRTATSPQVSVSFMPVEQQLPGPWPFTHNYWVEEQGGTFLSCDRELVRYDSNRNVLGRLTLPFACGADAELTLLDGGDRLLLKPGLGLVRFGPDLTQRLPLVIEGLQQAIAPASQPLVALSYNGIGSTLQAYGSDGSPLWTTGVAGLPAGALAYHRGRLVYPSFGIENPGSAMVDIGLQTFDIASGAPAGKFVLGVFKSDLMSDIVAPRITFDATGDTAYYADMSDPAFVRACESTSGRPCTAHGGGLRWISASLSGGLVAAVRTPHGLVAYGPRVAHFLDPDTGATIGEPLTPAGSLEYTHVLSSPEGAILLLAMGPGQAGIKQITIFDAPGQKVADYLTGTQGFIVDLDWLGRAWLWRNDLVKLLPASQYRAALQ